MDELTSFIFQPKTVVWFFVIWLGVETVIWLYAKYTDFAWSKVEPTFAEPKKPKSRFLVYGILGIYGFSFICWLLLA